MASCFCGAEGEFRCEYPSAEKRAPTQAARVEPGDRIAFQSRSQRVWKVLRVAKAGDRVEFDVECRIQRRQFVRLVEAEVIAVRLGTCAAACCYQHAREGAGPVLCRDHWIAVQKGLLPLRRKTRKPRRKWNRLIEADAERALAFFGGQLDGGTCKSADPAIAVPPSA